MIAASELDEMLTNLSIENMAVCVKPFVSGGVQIPDAGCLSFFGRIPMPEARPRVDYTGQTFFNWTVVQYIPYKHSTYLCRCVCGVEKEKQIHAVIRGKSKSCGCRRNAAVKKAADQAAAQAPIQKAAAVQPTPTPTPPSTSVEPEYRMREFNGHQIRQRVSDEYFDATAMCKVSGKLLADWKRSAGTKTQLEAISSVMGIPITELVVVEQGGNPKIQGTWVHRLAAIDLGRWLDPFFGVMISEWVLDLMDGRTPTGFQPAPAVGAPSEISAEMLLALNAQKRSDLLDALDAAARIERLQAEIDQETIKITQKLSPKGESPAAAFDPFVWPDDTNAMRGDQLELSSQ